MKTGPVDLLKSVRAGDPISARQMNILIELVKRSQPSVQQGYSDAQGVIQRPRIQSAVQTGFLAYIWFAGPSSEADYTDARYWFKRAGCANNTETTTDLANVSVLLETDPDYLHGTLTNIAEFLSMTHQLPVYSPVWVQEVEDLVGGTRYVTNTPPPDTFLAVLTGTPTPIAPNKWTYTFKEIIKTGAGVNGAWAFTAREGTCFNLYEIFNPTSGLLAVGVDTANLIGSMVLKPIPSGILPVKIKAIPVYTVPKTVEYVFEAPNGIDGACS